MKVVSFLVLIIKVDSFCFPNLVKHIHRIRGSWSWKTSLGSCGLMLFKLLTTAPYCTNVIFYRSQEELLCLLRGRGQSWAWHPCGTGLCRAGTHTSPCTGEDTDSVGSVCLAQILPPRQTVAEPVLEQILFLLQLF